MVGILLLTNVPRNPSSKRTPQEQTTFPSAFSSHSSYEYLTTLPIQQLLEIEQFLFSLTVRDLYASATSFLEFLQKGLPLVVIKVDDFRPFHSIECSVENVANMQKVLVVERIGLNPQIVATKAHVVLVSSSSAYRLDVEFILVDVGLQRVNNSLSIQLGFHDQYSVRFLDVVLSQVPSGNQ